MKISVIGTGYVGLVTATLLADIGNDVICVDKDINKIEMINSGNTPIYEKGLNNLLKKNLDGGKIIATSDLKFAIQNTGVTIICVGTPNIDGKIDLSQIKIISREISIILKDKEEYHVVVVKSTVLPMTTDTVVREILENGSNKKAGDFGLCMNPEFLREGSAVEDFLNPGRIVIGAFDEKTASIMSKLYENFDCPKIITNLRTAEMIKYTSNSLLATLISFSNEISNICQSMEGVDVINVLNGVHYDRRLMPFITDDKIKEKNRIKPGIISYLWAGCGYGGSCFPKDVQAFYNFALNQKYEPIMLRSTIEINSNQPKLLIQKARSFLKSFKNKRVAILGLAFKPNTDDIRESPSITIIQELIKEGATIICHDPNPKAIDNAKTTSLKDYEIIYADSKESAIESAEVIFLITSWQEYIDIQPEQFKKLIKGENPTIVDGRRIYDKKKIESLNINYIGIGIN